MIRDGSIYEGYFKNDKFERGHIIEPFGIEYKSGTKTVQIVQLTY